MSSNELDRALAGPIADTGRLIIALPEDQWFDRKSARVAPKDLAITLVALANAEGGSVVVGIHDGRIEGNKANPAHMNDLRQAAIDHTTPPVRAHVDQVSCINERGEPDVLLVFRVTPGESVHELTNGDCYLRVGDESRRLGFAQRQELHFDRGASQFDGSPVSGAGLDDVDADLTSAYRASAGFSGTTRQLLRNRGLITSEGTLTTAGYLLFASEPGQRFPQAHVRILRYLDNERGSGSRLSLEAGKDVRVEGPIPHIITEARQVIEEWQPMRRALDESGVFADQPVVPRDAWAEGLVNAVVHRSYSLAGDHIRVEIFPNRIEITSPGRFPGLADPSNPLDISRYARNPRLARVCTDLRITQELGEGIRRIFSEMRSRGLTDPVYSQGHGSVRLTLSGLSRIPAAVIDRLPRGSVETLNTLRRAGVALGTGDLQSLTDISRPTLLKQLAALRDEGLVIWSGKSPKDPRATWAAAEI
jgi:ATP-dependent DNA helicase RecG